MIEDTTLMNKYNGLVESSQLSPEQKQILKLKIPNHEETAGSSVYFVCKGASAKESTVWKDQQVSTGIPLDRIATLGEQCIPINMELAQKLFADAKVQKFTPENTTALAMWIAFSTVLSLGRVDKRFPLV